MLAGLAALLAIAQPQPVVPEQLPALALEVKNPRRTGRQILHFEDLIGPGARAVGAHQPARALLVVALSPRVELAAEGASPPPAPGGFELDGLAALAEQVKKRGGMVVVVLLTGGGQERRSEGSAIDPESWPFVVTVDPHGFARRRLGLLSAGRALVIRSDGRIVGAYGPEGTGFAAARGAFLQQLEEE